MKGLKSGISAIILATLLTGCSCEQRVARVERRCGLPMRVTVDTVIQVRDSLYLDTVFDVITDTLTFTRDSVTVTVILDTVHRTTRVTVTRPPETREVKVAVPVVVTAMATWSNWLAMTWRLLQPARWVLVPMFVLLLVFILFRVATIRK